MNVAQTVVVLDGSGGGGFGAELLLNTSFAGYVAGSPGTVPTSWLSLIATGSLAAPALTFDTSTTRRAIYQLVSVAAGFYKLETTVTVNSGTAAFWDLLYYAAPVGSTVKFFVDGVEGLGSASVAGTKTLRMEITVPIPGNIEFRIGAGVSGNRTQNVTHINPTMKKAS